MQDTISYCLFVPLNHSIINLRNGITKHIIQKEPHMMKLFFIPLLLSFSLLLVGCQNQKAEESEIAMTDLTITTPYTIVRSDNSESLITQLSVQLKNTVTSYCGEVSLTTDWSKDGGYDPTTPEILIGSTNRNESQIPAKKAAASGIANWYYIGVEGAKVVLNGSNDICTMAAVRRYITEFASLSTDSVFTVPTSLLQPYEPDSLFLIDDTKCATDVFVAISHLGKAPYYADATGSTDMTFLIKDALSRAEKAGGGTIYLPRGVYRISEPLSIPSYVTLRGDYADPDSEDITAGTVLLLAKKSSFKASSPVSIQCSGAIEGITFFYEAQSVEQPIEYAPTINLLSQTFTTVKDCNFMNSWIAISNGDKPNGMVTIDNVKGTALYTAIHVEQRADISVTTDIHFSPLYWAKGSEMFGEGPSENAIRALMKSNDSIGIYLGDIDRDTYENITLDGYVTAIYNRPMTRVGLSGSWYGLTIKNSERALYLEGVDTRYGLLITNADIDGDIVNATDLSLLTDPAEYSYIYMLNAKINGKCDGRIQNLFAGDEEVSYTAKSRDIPTPKAYLIDSADYALDTTGKTDCSAELQRTIHDCEAAGGGIVYLRPGHYLLEQPITIGENVQLLGAQQNPNGSANSFTGTILFITYGRNGSDDDPAAITVNGNNAGVSGMLIYYKENGVSTEKYMASTAEYSYFLRLTGKNTFARNLGMAAVSRAIHFDNAENFICDRILMTAYHNGITVTNSQHGIITRIHTNGTYHTMGENAKKYLSDDWCWSGSDVVVKILDAHIVHDFTLFTVDNSTDLQFTHVFHYGAYRYMDLTDSDVFILNGESARLTGLSFSLKNSNLRVIDFMRPNPSKYLTADQTSTYALYNMDAAHSGGQIVRTQK